MFRLDLEKAEEPKIKLPKSDESSKKTSDTIPVELFQILNDDAVKVLQYAS